MAFGSQAFGRGELCHDLSYDYKGGNVQTKRRGGSPANYIQPFKVANGTDYSVAE